MQVKVRYAPSPTGFQHIGGVRTALFNYLFARSKGGKFVLRIEDTDRTRYGEEYVKNLYDTLEWLGIDWDEGGSKGNPYDPYVQSKRFDLYLLLTILDENPELQTQEFAEEIRNLILQAVELEKEYNKDMLPKGILGLNADYVNQYVMHMTDRRLVELGFEPEYNVANPAKWMATANDTLELVNFFESTNTSYEVNTTK